MKEILKIVSYGCRFMAIVSFVIFLLVASLDLAFLGWVSMSKWTTTRTTTTVTTSEQASDDGDNAGMSPLAGVFRIGTFLLFAPFVSLGFGFAWDRLGSNLDGIRNALYESKENKANLVPKASSQMGAKQQPTGNPFDFASEG